MADPFWKRVIPSKQKCALCNMTAGEHESVNGWCPDPASIGYNYVWSKTSIFTTVLELGKIVKSKKYLQECPCGIYHGDCDYHK